MAPGPVGGDPTNPANPFAEHAIKTADDIMFVLVGGVQALFRAGLAVAATRAEAGVMTQALTEASGGTAQEFVADLSHVTGKGAAARNRAIQAIIKEDFPNLQLTETPEYSPFINHGVAQEGAGTQIGKMNFSSREALRRVIVHEELHHRWWAQGLVDHHPVGSASSDLFYETVERYMRMRGW